MTTIHIARKNYEMSVNGLLTFSNSVIPMKMGIQYFLYRWTMPRSVL